MKGATHFGKGGTTNERRQPWCEMTFGSIREFFQHQFRDHERENTIPKKFKPFITRVIFRLFEARMGQCQFYAVFVIKAVLRTRSPNKPAP